MELAAIEQKVDEICTQFKNDARISVSDHARKLASTVLSAISQDPHPAWKDGADLNSLTQAYLSALPIMLYQIASSEGVKDKITSFDFLHWFSKYFETMMMCIIPKKI